MPLDRERQAHHHLVLKAMDWGAPSRSNATPVQLMVADANGNPPSFTLHVYSASVRENLPANSALLRVIAKDTDEGGNAQITYPFINVGEAARQLFRLGSKTRELSTSAELDFEERANYTLRVEARDGRGHSACCKIQIEILDENNKCPGITLASGVPASPRGC